MTKEDLYLMSNDELSERIASSGDYYLYNFDLTDWSCTGYLITAANININTFDWKVWWANARVNAGDIEKEVYLETDECESPQRAVAVLYLILKEKIYEN